MSKSLDIIYHFAHAINYGKKISIITLVDAEQGIVKIRESRIKSDSNNDILVRFLPGCTKTIFATETGSNLALEIDIYSGIIGLNYYTTYTPPTYVSIPSFDNRSPHSYGYIMESPPRMTLLFCKKLASIENFQSGALKFHISSFDSKGYPKYLFPEAILELVQLVEPINCPLLESVTMKEVREQKDESAIASTIEMVTPEILPQVQPALLESTVEIAGATHTEDVTLHS